MLINLNEELHDIDGIPMAILETQKTDQVFSDDQKATLINMIDSLELGLEEKETFLQFLQAYNLSTTSPTIITLRTILKQVLSKLMGTKDVEEFAILIDLLPKVRSAESIEVDKETRSFLIKAIKDSTSIYDIARAKLMEVLGVTRDELRK